MRITRDNLNERILEKSRKKKTEFFLKTKQMVFINFAVSVSLLIFVKWTPKPILQTIL